MYSNIKTVVKYPLNTRSQVILSKCLQRYDSVTQLG